MLSFNFEIKNYFLKFIFVPLIFVHQCCFSQATSNSLVDLTCKGSNSGTSVKTEYREFDMTVDTTTGEMFNYPNIIAVACTGSSTKETVSCVSGSTYITCQCEKLNLLPMNGTMQLSRNTGKLKITTSFNDGDKWVGDYSCEKVLKKKF
jgi:hypothetical protein